MKICIVTEVYYPFIGGISEHIYNLKLNLKELGHKVKILTSEYGGNSYDRDPDVHRIGRAFKFRKAGSHYLITLGYNLSRQVKDFLTGENFDIIHIQGPIAPVLPYLALRYSTTTNIATFHSALVSSIGYTLFTPILEQYFSRLHGLIAVSEVARNAMARYFPGEYHIIPNGVDTERFNPRVQPRKELINRKPIILFVNRLEPRKGLKYLIQALPKILKVFPDVTLVIVGDGKPDSLCRRLIERDLKEKVILVGKVAPDEMASYYASCDLFCAPSIGLESFGIVLLEAMASARPIIAADIDGFHSVLTQGEEGLFFRVGDPDSIADVAIKILKNRELGLKLGEAGRRKALLYDWRKITRDIENFYKEAAERGPRKKTDSPDF